MSPAPVHDANANGSEPIMLSHACRLSRRDGDICGLSSSSSSPMPFSASTFGVDVIA